MKQRGEGGFPGAQAVHFEPKACEVA
jgi:hypothetical protein